MPIVKPLFVQPPRHGVSPWQAWPDGMERQSLWRQGRSGCAAERLMLT